MKRIRTGLEELLESPPRRIAGKRLGLLCNTASVDHRYRHARRLVDERFPGRLAAIYSPQHGFFADKQDNMIESADTVDPVLGIPVFSLYGETRTPSAEMLDPIDVLLIDLQDVGTRVYTFATTVSYCLEAAKSNGKTVLVLDRPNPLGGVLMEGNCLAPDVSSFVGRYPIPMRHGLTLGELALLMNTHDRIACELAVLPMKGWSRSMVFENTGLPWVPPSPNLPIPESAVVYPGQVVWEGTNVSEGRGTTRPFEIFGAPFIDTRPLMDDWGECPGAVLRPCAFEPTWNKWQGQLCQGFQIHVTDRTLYRPYRTSLGLLQSIFTRFSGDCRWKDPPYEYEYNKMPIDLILGDPNLRESIVKGTDIAELEAAWEPGLREYQEAAREHMLYPWPAEP